ncbi:MAG TPA: Crp/Fnr family transcriptional regulator [Thermodesulfobacteriota bacterium]|nr:Crp/Fnr family transcriptional regulator [Thermodesulfobacteriota bacterium]
MRITKSCSTCNLRAGTIFAGLDSTGVIELESKMQRFDYPRDFVLFLKGEKPRGIYCICSGRVKLSAHSPDGRGIIAGYPTAGSVIGVRAVLSGKTHDFTARTVEESQLSFIDKDDFLEVLKRNGAVCMKLAESLCEELSKAYTDIKNAALAGPEERLASLLLRLCEEFGEPTPEGIVINLGVSQDEMAELAGMSRRTLTRALKKLRKMDLIECGRRKTLVRSKTGLESLIT